MARSEKKRVWLLMTEERIHAYATRDRMWMVLTRLARRIRTTPGGLLVRLGLESCSAEVRP